MEEKRTIKVSLGTVIYIFIIILLILVIGGMYYYYNYIANNNVETKQENIILVDNTKNDIQYKEITEEFEGTSGLFVTNAIKNTDGTYTLKGVKYQEKVITENELQTAIAKGEFQVYNSKYRIEERLQNTYEYNLYSETDSEEPLYIIKKQENSNNYYLEGQIQIQQVWEITEEYMQITLDGEIIVNKEGGNTTVEENFKNYESIKLEKDTFPGTGSAYGFVFENNECTEVIYKVTSI